MSLHCPHSGPTSQPRDLVRALPSSPPSPSCRALGPHALALPLPHLPQAAHRSWQSTALPGAPAALKPWVSLLPAGCRPASSLPSRLSFPERASCFSASVSLFILFFHPCPFCMPSPHPVSSLALREPLSPQGVATFPLSLCTIAHFCSSLTHFGLSATSDGGDSLQCSFPGDDELSCPGFLPSRLLCRVLYT